jgi:hypothetical protein
MKHKTVQEKSLEFGQIITEKNVIAKIRAKWLQSQQLRKVYA